MEDWGAIHELLPSNVFKSSLIFSGAADGNPAENFTLDAKIIVKSTKHNTVDDFILSDDYFCLLKERAV